MTELESEESECIPLFFWLCLRLRRLHSAYDTGKNNGFPVLDIFGYLKNTHKNPKFGRVRQVPIWELGWEFRGWDLSHFAKFGIFMGISKTGNPLFFPVWSSENQIVGVGSRRISQSQCTFPLFVIGLVLLLLLPTPKIWFSLDHKRNVSDEVISGIGTLFSLHHKLCASDYDSDCDSVASENQP